MRILCLIDSLGSGGAQRQLSYLAALLKEAGHDVTVLTYHDLNFFQPYLAAQGVRVDCLGGLRPLRRIVAVRKAIRSANPDAVIAFLPTPSLLAELAGLPKRRFKLIVSERSLDIKGLTLAALRRFLFHALADHVVANSHAQADFIRKNAPWLAKRISTIVNCVDLNEFRPKAFSETKKNAKVSFLVLASFTHWKNPVGLVDSFVMVHQRRPDLNWSVDWYGNNLMRNGIPSRHSFYQQTEHAIRLGRLESSFHLHDPCLDTAALYKQADALLLPSLFEGCPNVLCEAFACGLPVLASRVGDMARLIEHGVNGLLFDPQSTADICRAIERFCDLGADDFAAIGKANRQRAETLFSFGRFVDDYGQLLRN